MHGEWLMKLVLVLCVVIILTIRSETNSYNPSKMLCKVGHCAERVSAKSRIGQLHWGDQEMGTTYYLMHKYRQWQSRKGVACCPNMQVRFQGTRFGSSIWHSQ